MLSNTILRNLLSVSRNVVFQRAGGCVNVGYVPQRTVKSNTSNKLDRELEDALKIEASLFDNSTINHEPVKAAEVLKTPKKSLLKSSGATSGKLVKKAVKPTLVLSKDQDKQIKRKVGENDTLIKDPALGLDFFRLSLGDRKLSTLMTKVRSRKRRDKDREILIEGRRLIEEALDCGLVMETLVFSKKEEVEKLKEKLKVASKKYGSQFLYVRQHDVKTWSSLTTPPGLMAVFKRPTINMHYHTADEERLPISVICDNIREPNNLGSIIRTCASVPCKEMIITKGCCDPWDTKALRGGCGGHFRIPIQDDVSWSEMYTTIPPELAHNCNIYIAENNMEKVSKQPGISALDYSQVKEIGAHNIVIIGGESHGVSQEAYKFMEQVGDRRGKCLYIPLSSGMDSLNVVSALTLILFELRKQLLPKSTTIPDPLNPSESETHANTISQ